MSHSLKTLACLLSFSALASAQVDMSSRLRPAPTPKDAGTYHVATGTWTRGLGTIAGLLGDVRYDNTCTSGLQLGLAPGERLVDSGRFPSLTSSPVYPSLTGDWVHYQVDAIKIGYCTGSSQLDARVSFYDCYAPCSDATALTPSSTITALGMPGASGTGGMACWLVTLDLYASSSHFLLAADCDGVYDVAPSNNNFGWSFEQLNAAGSAPTGVLVAGDPQGHFHTAPCSYGDGTIWSFNTDPGTGIGTVDNYELDAGGTMLGCFFFGGYGPGNAYASFYLQVLAEWDSPPPTNDSFCSGNTDFASCPCGNNNDGSQGFAGCANGASSAGARLDGSGNTDRTQDLYTLIISGLEPGQPGLLFQGSSKVNGGAGLAFGDGLRCVGGSVQRIEVLSASGSGNALSIAFLGALANTGSETYYQFWYRNPTGSPCGSNFNLSNALQVYWQ